MCCEYFHPCDCPADKPRVHCLRCTNKLHEDEVALCFNCEEGQ